MAATKVVIQLSQITQNCCSGLIGGDSAFPETDNQETTKPQEDDTRAEDVLSILGGKGLEVWHI